MILIHIPKLSNRISYIFDFIFKSILQTEIELTVDTDDFLNFKGAKFSYGKHKLDEDIIHFPSANGLLLEDTIVSQSNKTTKWNKYKVVYPVSDGPFPFDPFAASFFLISRYEEYLPHTRDKHNRYPAEKSTAHLGGYLDKPVIDMWAFEIKNILLKKFPDIHFEPRAFTILPTIDIDNAYAYKYKGFVRSVGGCIKKLLNFETKGFKKRLNVHLGLQKDPYDSYDKQIQINEKYNIKPIYFFHLGDYGMYDTNASYKHKKIVQLIKKLASKYPICLHPSYKSNTSKDMLGVEKKRLESILNKTVTKSRQHYLKLNIPETYNNLIKLGIKEDYSMGYPSKTGFRASTCTPFYFFNLDINEITELKISPFCVMDTTLKQYLKVRGKNVLSTIKPLVEDIKSVEGTFSYIFHNESIGGEKIWRNWKNTYENVIKLALESEPS